MSINITINGEKQTLNEGVSVLALLERRKQAAGVAVAVNGEFVPKSQHSTRLLQNGDEVDIVAPMQGG